jgi:hypothetical protein
MDLVLSLNGQEVARLKNVSTKDYIKEIENLKIQYKDQIEKSGAAAEFCIENVPSIINSFKPLGH